MYTLFRKIHLPPTITSDNLNVINEDDNDADDDDEISSGILSQTWDLEQICPGTSTAESVINLIRPTTDASYHPSVLVCAQHDRDAARRTGPAAAAETCR